MKSELESYIISLEQSLREALSQIDRNGQGIVFVTDGERRLLGSLSDGDVRRAMLMDIDLSVTLHHIPTCKQTPIFFSPGASDSDLLAVMNEKGVRQIPIVNPSGQIVDIVFMSDLVSDNNQSLRAVIMAGGYGSRLKPLTNHTPKPMLKVGGRPMLQRTIEQLKGIGIDHFDVATHYKADVIAGHFGDGREFGVHIEYVREDTPLGTAGALRMVNGDDQHLLIMNGDILTQVNFRAMLDYHRAHSACLTVGVRRYEMQVPYGVVECEGATITKIKEKPRFSFLVNAGIYLLDPAARNCIPSDRRFDMTDLIQLLIERDYPVISFPIAEYWLDVGSPMDYAQAQQDVLDGRIPA